MSLFKIIGIAELKRKMKQREAKRGRKFRQWLALAGLHIQRSAQKKCPVDTGLLRNSARTELDGVGIESECEVSFSTSYAIFVHEDLEAHHEVGEAKFLEKAVQEKKPEIIAMIKDKMRYE